MIKKLLFLIFIFTKIFSISVEYKQVSKEAKGRFIPQIIRDTTKEVIAINNKKEILKARLNQLHKELEAKNQELKIARELVKNAIDTKHKSKMLMIYMQKILKLK